ncbi:hypothetical protein ABIA32_003937 [Streptacidiphilus sp. MAP12-20]|uniref:hypothetical protein n=1 Tax=Streptacidiphilus sp. MAP12-20 TaxID=3156299 RepID=UPI003512E7DD
MIGELEKRLTQFAMEHANGRSDALSRALSSVLHPPVFRALVGEVIGREDFFGEVLARSLWHPNGFAKIVLLTAPEFRLRLHAWRTDDAASAADAENIHNHRWDFTAAILAGGYRHQEFQVSEQGQSFFGYRYRSADDQSSYSLVPLGRRTLKCVFDAHLTQGTRYTMSSTVLHRVRPDPAQAAISLVLEGPHLPAAVEVFAEVETEKGTDTPFVRLSPDALLHHLRTVSALPAFG